MIFTPTVLNCEVLSQSFVVRLKEMEQVIQDQKEVIENLTKVIEEASLKNIVQAQNDTIQNQEGLIEDLRTKLTTGNKVFHVMVNAH